MPEPIDELVKEIPDQKLRAKIESEVRKLKQQKKYGLVFEQHIPEVTLLPNLPITLGAHVVKRNGKPDETYSVTDLLNGSKARITRDNTDESETVKLTELVVLKKFGEPIYPTLVPVDSVTRAPDKPYHTLINADNYHALQLLLYCYEGQVDVVYIDPPYNTGARDWKYNNDYVDSNDRFRHSKWLSMMKKRLALAKQLLKRNGVLVIAIDENEMHHLRSLLEDGDLFGENAFLGTIVIRSKPSGNQTKEELAVSHEYAFFVAASDKGRVHALERNERQLARFDQSDENGSYYWENLRRHGANSRREDRPGLFYPIWVRDSGKIEIPKGEWDARAKKWSVQSAPFGAVEVWPMRQDDERVWAYAPDRARKEMPNLLAKETSGEWQIYRKVRMREVGVMPQTIWAEKQYSATEYGTNILKSIFGESEKFPYPKSIYTVMDCIRVASNNPNALILDFFAGSGTTLHSTILLNAEDGGTRRCIMITNNEVNEKVAHELHQQGHFQGDNEFERLGICEAVTYPRSRIIINGKRDDGVELSGASISGRPFKEGFEENLAYFKLDFLDPEAVAYGDKFEAIVPILWLFAGAQGELETARGYGKYFIPKHSPYAVLIQEESFAAFKRELEMRPDITHVFLITDSEESYREMLADLPGKYITRMLYKSYLDNFKINLESPA